MLDANDPLIALADAIEWDRIIKGLEKYYDQTNGRPGKPILLMVGLLLLKQLENLSDESVVLQWKRNPYYQYFCGMNDYCSSLPCDPSELSQFRKRIGQEGVDVIFSVSVALHPQACEEERVIIDTTAQEKNITYPTDGKLAIKIINRLHKIAKSEGIALRRTYLKEIKGHRIILRFFRHPKKRSKAVSAMKRLRSRFRLVVSLDVAVSVTVSNPSPTVASVLSTLVSVEVLNVKRVELTLVVVLSSVFLVSGLGSFMFWLSTH